ncbi:hypothetical protein L195_g049205 [Trifolium pratense]|uniref:Uncharacterized protein n=1 Tax=Trifolium pratense TaxID=57577 RepID=A0A2K3JNG8_TRIPR|nr:hypothetical protein L195_g049205 [Trifolium pratense]
MLVANIDFCHNEFLNDFTIMILGYPPPNAVTIPLARLEAPQRVSIKVLIRGRVKDFAISAVTAVAL